MPGALKDLEKALTELFVDKLPALPPKTKEFIVKYLPWLNLAGGAVALWLAYSMWNSTRVVDSIIDYTNRFSDMYGLTSPVTHRWTATMWLSILVLAVEAVLYIAAFSATRDRKKQGWNMMFYALLVNVAYGVVVMFTSYGDFGSLLGSVVGTAFGLYFLFQIRGEYMAKTEKK